MLPNEAIRREPNVKRWIIPAVAALAALAVFTVACGDDDDPAPPAATPVATQAPADGGAAVSDYLSNVCEPRDIAVEDTVPIDEARARLESVRERWRATVPPDELAEIHDLTLSTIDGVVRIVADVVADAPEAIYGDAHWAVITVIHAFSDLVRDAYGALPQQVRAQFEERGCEPLAGEELDMLDDYISHVCGLSGLEVSGDTPLDGAVTEYRALRERWREADAPDVLLEHQEVSLAMINEVIRALEAAVADPERATFADAHDEVFDAMGRYRDRFVAIDADLPDPVRAEFIVMGCSVGSLPVRSASSDLDAVDEYLSHVCGLSGLTLTPASPLDEAVTQYQALRERWRDADPPDVLLEHQEVSLAMVDAIIRVLRDAADDPEQEVFADAFSAALLAADEFGDALTDAFEDLPAEIQNEFRALGCVQESP